MLEVTNIASAAFIFCRDTPIEIFLEKKDNSYPMKEVRGQLFPIGENWIGDNAARDKSPLDTVERAIKEELTFERPKRSTKELAQLGLAEQVVCPPATLPNGIVCETDKRLLGLVRAQMISSLLPFGGYINAMPNFSTLVFYWLVPLPIEYFIVLQRLQLRFGNLSNESTTVITSLGQIIDTGAKMGLGHDKALRDFWLSLGYTAAKELQTPEGITSKLVGQSQDYQDILKEFDVKTTPIG